MALELKDTRAIKVPLAVPVHKAQLEIKAQSVTPGHKVRQALKDLLEHKVIKAYLASKAP